MADEIKKPSMTDGEYEKPLIKVSLVCAGVVALFWWVWSWFANVPVYQNAVEVPRLAQYLLNGWSRWWDVPVMFLLINIFGWVSRLLYIAGKHIYSTRENAVISFLFTCPCLLVVLSAIVSVFFLFNHEGPLYGVVIGGVFGVTLTAMILGALFLAGLLLSASREVYSLLILLMHGLRSWLQRSEIKS